MGWEGPTVTPYLDAARHRLALQRAHLRGVGVARGRVGVGAVGVVRGGVEVGVVVRGGVGVGAAMAMAAMAVTSSRYFLWRSKKTSPLCSRSNRPEMRAEMCFRHTALATVGQPTSDHFYPEERGERAKQDIVRK